MIGSDDEARAWFREVVRVNAEAMGRLERFGDLLVQENQRQNLISKGSAAHLWVRHLADSAQLLRVPRGTIGRNWLDLGTGAGFPGLVIAICRPDIAVTMVDARRLRTDWLRQVTSALGLNNTEVIQSRVESVPNQTYDTISARAFAPIDKLLEVSARFSTSDTQWLLPKGAKAEQELLTLPQSWDHLFHVEQSMTDPNAGIITGRLLGRSREISQSLALKGPSR